MHFPGATPAASSGSMNIISALLEQRTGQQIAANRAWRIETALKPLLREKGLASLDQLVAQLVATRTGDLGDQVVDALKPGDELLPRRGGARHDRRRHPGDAG